MLAILLHSINKPEILTHSTLLKKHIIIRLVMLLGLVLSIPTIIHTNQLLQQTRNDLAIITAHLPETNTQTPNAIQTTQAYFLYDPTSNVTETTLKKTVPQYTLSIIVQNKIASIYILGSHVLTHSAQSSEHIKDLLLSLTATLPFTQLLTPLIVLFFNILSVIVQNYIFTFACQLFFMFRQKLVKFQHLWRVSLFASFGPYVILSVLNLFKLYVPFELLWALLYIIYVQSTVIKAISVKE